MQLKPNEQERLRRYLLGSLPSDELAPIEERLFTDSAFYDELLIVEDELIDQYLRGQQTEAERAGFEGHFLLTQERQQKTRFARSLHQYLDGLEETPVEGEVAGDELEQPRSAVPARGPVKRRFWFFLPQNPVLSYSLAAALVLVVGAVSWTALRSFRQTVTPESGQILAAVLTPGLTRAEGDRVPRLQIPAGISTLQLHLVLPAAVYESYRAELLTSERVSVWTGDGIQSHTSSGSKSVLVMVPARLLQRDDYQVKLTGRQANGIDEDIATYVFRVVN